MATPLQCSCLETPMNRGAWRGHSPWGRKESDRAESTQHACIHTLRSVSWGRSHFITLHVVLNVESCPR